MARVHEFQTRRHLLDGEAAAASIRFELVLGL